MKTYWLSNTKMTVSVDVNDKDIIIEGAPVVRKFVGQYLDNLVRWMKKFPGFKMQQINND